MTIVTMPSNPGFGRTRFGLVSNTQNALISPITKTSQLLELPGARWRASYALPPMSTKDATHAARIADWRVFLTGLRGQVGQFYGFDPDHRTPRGTARLKSAGSLTVAAGSPSASGVTIPIAGADPNETGVFLKGDYLAFDVGTGRQLFMAAADATPADSSGELEVTIEPPIRTPPAGGETIIFTDASCVMRLADDEVSWPGDQRGVVSIAFEAIEVFA